MMSARQHPFLQLLRSYEEDNLGLMPKVIRRKKVIGWESLLVNLIMMMGRKALFVSASLMYLFNEIIIKGKALASKVNS